MLDTATKKRIDDCRDILVGKLPDPKAQIEQITIGLIYKFMDDMDKEAIELGGKAKFFSDYKIPNPEFPSDRKKDIVVSFAQYSWDNLFNAKVTATEMLRLYQEAIQGMDKNPNIPQLFRDIFKNAYLPYRDPETLKLFLKTISEFEYTHSEKLGDAFEYLLSVMGSQGDAGQFRTPRHIIDFVVAAVNPSKTDTILDPACGTAGFLISAFKHIKEKNKKGLTPDERKKLIQNFVGYDISPDMVRLSLVNLYLHGFNDPHIWEYDTLSSEERWDETFDVVLANPPFMSPKGGIRPHKKFTISSNRSEVLFVDYIAEHLNPKGRAGIIVPEGVIFQSGGAYKDLRKMLVEKYLYAVVSLPAGVFNPYSGVKTSILLMDKEFAKQNSEILFVKIDNDGFGLGAQRNAVKGGQLQEAVKLLQQFKEGNFIESEIAHAVSKKEIAKNGDYNLSGERYSVNEKLIHTKFDLVELGQITTLSTGGTPTSSKKEYYENGEIKWLVSGDIHKGKIYDCEGRITELGMKESNARYLPENSVMMALNGQGKTRGSVALLKTKGTCNQSLVAITPTNDKQLLSEYLYEVLRSMYMDIRNLTGHGERSGLNMPIIRRIQIPLPPLSVQEEIVADIEGYQKIIDGAKAVVENYKPKIDINPDWDQEKLGDISEFKNGLNFSKQSVGEHIKILGVSHFKDRLIAPLSELEEIQVNENINDNYLLKKGDLVFVRSNGNKDLVGRSLVIPEVNERISFSGFTIRCRLKKGIEPMYIGYLFKSDIHSKLMRNTGRGANITNLSQEILNDIVIPVPPLQTQREIVHQLEKEQALIDASKQLIEIFEQKIKDRIAKVWGK
jgi:type I restriction enzyme M protein